ncbi:hypothetical protein RchiOBHm_Chr2g0166881 [Rosa chinensis]|uniref:Uncharacterized protein n=1 Tax=Rosa chinensis TaxID=74649 RepID=A0A2P6S465_ROSCH|nr:hypothetical protein RchiOBHm_Chr2g0166881 [Rosa chinensis]
MVVARPLIVGGALSIISDRGSPASGGGAFPPFLRPFGGLKTDVDASLKGDV